MAGGPSPYASNLLGGIATDVRTRVEKSGHDRWNLSFTLLTGDDRPVDLDNSTLSQVMMTAV